MRSRTLTMFKMWVMPWCLRVPTSLAPAHVAKTQSTGITPITRAHANSAQQKQRSQRSRARGSTFNARNVEPFRHLVDPLRPSLNAPLLLRRGGVAGGKRVRTPSSVHEPSRLLRSNPPGPRADFTMSTHAAACLRVSSLNWGREPAPVPYSPKNSCRWGTQCVLLFHSYFTTDATSFYSKHDRCILPPRLGF